MATNQLPLTLNSSFGGNNNKNLFSSFGGKDENKESKDKNNSNNNVFSFFSGLDIAFQSNKNEMVSASREFMQKKAEEKVLMNAFQNEKLKKVESKMNEPKIKNAAISQAVDFFHDEIKGNDSFTAAVKKTKSRKDLASRRSKAKKEKAQEKAVSYSAKSGSKVVRGTKRKERRERLRAVY